ncbi:DUF2807 domain-containing protein [Undibacterium sp. LX40W]|uniref:DUF2807 domain-containing protein n=1 Tax=Undibacterium nitidum TaxID=2762298 RepID=A0A923KTR6_9BURK|nr:MULTISPECIES: head GIN domain-containing protein [Undibacterium]MBC3881507.1 DUF2807 domain-containing protein [Undibacterium nitidum]MBC3891711.1 DUF2807 domain-containing protein [Undibacterium sp. LX40W]
MKTLFTRRHMLLASVAGLTTLAFCSAPASAEWLGSWGKSVEGSGKIIKQEFVVKDFRAVAIAVPAKVELKQGDTESVQVETDDNIQAMLDVVVEGNTLKIRTKEKNVYPKTRTFNVIVNVKKIDDLALENSGKVSSTKIVAGDLKIRVGGSGDILIQDLKADTLRATIGGSGSFTANGNVSQISGSIGGSGELNLGKLAAKDVRISIGGSGSVETWATDNLNVSIGGSGSVNYYGDPRVTKNIGGSGNVTRKGSAP